MSARPKLLPDVTFVLLVLALSCSGQNSALRSPTPDHPSSDTKSDDGTGNDGNPSDNRHDTIAKAADVIPIAGTNLTEVLVYVKCVSGIDCKSVRLGANIKVGSQFPIRFAADTLAVLGIKSSSWKFSDLPLGVSCQSDVDGYAYNPLCSASSSLSTARIKATLTLTATDGSAAKGDSPNTAPSNDGVIVGNFMKLSASSGFVPSGITYSGASSAFTEIWKDLVSGQYLTNILYDGGGTPSGTDWDKSTSLCASVDSGDGTGKWRLPREEEFCGLAYVFGCNGGFYSHDIKNVTFAGGDWSSNYFWSSSPDVGNSGSAWYVMLSNGNSHFYAKGNSRLGALCVR